MGDNLVGPIIRGSFWLGVACGIAGVAYQALRSTHISYRVSDALHFSVGVAPRHVLLLGILFFLACIAGDTYQRYSTAGRR